jgi:hypothetical protein
MIEEASYEGHPPLFVLAPWAIYFGLLKTDYGLPPEAF